MNEKETIKYLKGLIAGLRNKSIILDSLDIWRESVELPDNGGYVAHVPTGTKRITIVVTDENEKSKSVQNLH